jgi:hypothetical protein
MNKWIHILYPLIIAQLLLVCFSAEVKVPEELKVNEPVAVNYPLNKVQFEKQEKEVLTQVLAVPPFLGTTFIGFREALAFKESQGDYFSINSLGYLGKYQFGVGTLQLIGVHNATNFLNDPVLQERAFKTNIERNKWILRRDILKFDGKRIRGTEITESGMLAAAHLAGPGNVQKYLYSWGKKDVKDAYGTSIAAYMKKFSGYDTSVIMPKRNPRIL